MQCIYNIIWEYKYQKASSNLLMAPFLLSENHPLDGWFKRGYADEC